MVGIVGPSGSGKSTFAKLVQRLYVPGRAYCFPDAVFEPTARALVGPAAGRPARGKQAGSKAAHAVGVHPALIAAPARSQWLALPTSSG